VIAGAARHPRLLFGASVVAFVVVVGLLADVVSPQDPLRQNLGAKLMPPGSHERGWGWHLLGTDHLGRDILSRMVHGARVSLFVAGRACRSSSR
jgi:peptide/nickel transport system permease protein